MAKKREIPNLVEEIVKETETVSKETELIDKYQKVTSTLTPTLENKSVRIYPYVKPSVKKRLNEYSKTKNISINQIVNDLLEEFLDKEGM